MYAMRENETRATWNGAIDLGTEFHTGYLVSNTAMGAKEVRQYYADPAMRALPEATWTAARAELTKNVLAVIGRHCRALTCETNTHQCENGKPVRAYVYTVHVEDVLRMEDALTAEGYEVVRILDGTSAKYILKNGDAIRMRKFDEN